MNHIKSFVRGKIFLNIFGLKGPHNNIQEETKPYKTSQQNKIIYNNLPHLSDEHYF